MEKSKKLDSKTAYKLLTEGIIKEDNDLKEPKNRWILHCTYSGIAAGRIAERLGLDSDYATALGYVHDIGRRISHPKHITEGYYYMQELGYNEEARICLTHSFIYNDITLAAGPFPNERPYKMIREHLEEKDCSIYDNIIQLCDLFCLETGFTTLEKRILDISLRKGVFPSSKRHFEKALELKEKLDKQIGGNIYELFPEIPQTDLENKEEHLAQLKELFADVRFTPLNIGISEENILPKENEGYYLDKLLRDGHKVIFIPQETSLSSLKNQKIDIIYSNDDSSWGDLIEMGIPSFLIEPVNDTDNSFPKVSTWNEIYKQISILASDDRIVTNNNKPTKLVKK